MTRACRYQKAAGNAYGQNWDTECGYTIHCEAPIEVGITFTPLPTDDGKHYCEWCGGKKKLAEKPLEKHTYDGWIAKGFHVMRGQRHVERNANNECLFTEEQVAKTTPKFSDIDHDDHDLDDMYWFDKD